MPYITQLERLYRQISQPSPPQSTPAPVTAELKPALTRADVNDIIRRTRPASPEELQDIIARAVEFKLTTWERNELGVRLSIAAAQRARQVNGRREDPAAQFISRTLGLAETPFGLISREWVNNQMRTGAQAISRCKLHRPPLCSCWASQRAILWQVQSAHGERTPEFWSATRVFAFLEDLELSSRPERGPGLA